MKTDITSKEDIHFIIKRFYTKLLADDELQVFFQEFVQNKTLNHHLNSITDFWNDILFNTNSYQNNTMQKHLDFAAKIPFTKEHFKCWTSYFFEVIDTDFSGVNAEVMKNRAASIATVMQLKMSLFGGD